MTTNHHTVITVGAAANASVFNAPLSQLDTAITTNATNVAATTAEVVAARDAYPSLDSRLDALVMAGGNVATKANGASVAGQKVLTVDSTTGFIVGAYVTYLLNNTTLEGNTIASIQAGVSLTLGTNIGTGGVLDDSYISMISTSEYLAAQAIPHAGTLLLPQTMEYANGGVFNVRAYGAVGNGTTDDTAAIQAALDAMPADGGKLFFPLGAYKITAPLVLDLGVTVEGASRYGTRILNYGDDDCFYVASATGYRARHLTFRDLYIQDGLGIATRAAGHGIHLTGVDGTTFHIENVVVTGHIDGVNVENSINTVISNVRVDDNKRDGFATSGTCNGLSMISTYSVRAGRHGYNMKVSEASFITAESDQSGWLEAGDGFHFVDSHYLTFSGIGCEYAGCGRDGAVKAFTVDTGTNLLTITGNPFVDGDTIEIVTSDVTALPASIYQVRDTAGDSFKVASTFGGAAIDITDGTSGTAYQVFGGYGASFDNTDFLIINGADINTSAGDCLVIDGGEFISLNAVYTSSPGGYGLVLANAPERMVITTSYFGGGVLGEEYGANVTFLTSNGIGAGTPPTYRLDLLTPAGTTDIIRYGQSGTGQWLIGVDNSNRTYFKQGTTVRFDIDDGAATNAVRIDASGLRLASAVPLLYAGTQVVAARQTGWTAATGTATRTTFATASVTTEQLAQAVKALIDDLIAHGLIGA